jgi:hypothetical protein
VDPELTPLVPVFDAPVVLLDTDPVPTPVVPVEPLLPTVLEPLPSPVVEPEPPVVEPEPPVVEPEPPVVCVAPLVPAWRPVSSFEEHAVRVMRSVKVEASRFVEEEDCMAVHFSRTIDLQAEDSRACRSRPLRSRTTSSA